MSGQDPDLTPAVSLAPETIVTVRETLARYRQDRTDTPALHATLHSMAREARTSGVLPEQLLIVLKDIWYGLPEARRHEEPADQSRLLQRVVTACIKGYYTD
jgi:hypothetical protein